MKILIQRVSRASVEVDGIIVGEIDEGVLVFVGVASGDTKDKASWLAAKLLSLRIFPDQEQKLNLSLLDIKGQALVVSQFTLYGDCSHGRRPSFSLAASPEEAREIYEVFVEEVKNSGLNVQTGVFGAKMKVSLVNEGPITLLVDR